MAEEIVCPYCGHKHQQTRVRECSLTMKCMHCYKQFLVKVSDGNHCMSERMKALDRYQIITYDRDSGTDEKLEYQTLDIAVKEALKHFRGSLDEQPYEGVIVYDLETHKIVRIYGEWPDGAMPREDF